MPHALLPVMMNALLDLVNAYPVLAGFVVFWTAVAVCISRELR